jgi:hypothetical protein
VLRRTNPDAERLLRYLIAKNKVLRRRLKAYERSREKEAPTKIRPNSSPKRPQGVGNEPLQAVADEPASEGQIVCHERLGGVLRHYERKAA